MVSKNVAEIRAVIDVMVERGAVEVELEAAGTRIRVRLKEDRPVSMMPISAAHAGVLHPAPAVLGAAPAAAPAAAAPAAHDHHVFKSPMVGTFYRSPSPEAEVFVEVGSRVGPDSTLCILEAMKVMNEIKAELSGTVVEVLAQNGEPIEFGQPLFLIDLD
ncbi:MAG: acetyl-CoA carboxylase biotin carboxyl carrier protein [Planctomycetes bacterium]|nr:acetyl-CoA carboxylase biotin carboxyl carrier protein [Planctomycetota bacterium]